MRVPPSLYLKTELMTENFSTYLIIFPQNICFKAFVARSKLQPQTIYINIYINHIVLSETRSYSIAVLSHQISEGLRKDDVVKICLIK